MKRRVKLSQITEYSFMTRAPMDQNNLKSSIFVRKTENSIKNVEIIRRTSNSSRIKWGADLCSAMTLELCREFSGRKIENQVQLAARMKKSPADSRKIKRFHLNCVKITQIEYSFESAMKPTKNSVLCPIRVWLKHETESQFKLIQISWQVNVHATNEKPAERNHQKTISPLLPQEIVLWRRTNHEKSIRTSLSFVRVQLTGRRNTKSQLMKLCRKLQNKRSE